MAGTLGELEERRRRVLQWLTELGDFRPGAFARTSESVDGQTGSVLAPCLVANVAARYEPFLR